MNKPMIKIAAAIMTTLLLTACGGDREPTTPSAPKCCETCSNAPAFGQDRILQKTQGRAAHIGDSDVYDIGTNPKIQFPEGYEAKCAYEKERGACALLGLAADQAFQKERNPQKRGVAAFSKSERAGRAKTRHLLSLPRRRGVSGADARSSSP